MCAGAGREKWRTVVKELAKWGGATGAPSLFAVDAVQVEIYQHRQAAAEEHPPRGFTCRRCLSFNSSRLLTWHESERNAC